MASTSTEIIDRFNLLSPETFCLETTLTCNLKCPECALGGGMIGRSKGFMSFDTFKIVADKIRPFVKYFYLHIWGEPMLNKDIIPMIKYASTFTKTNISTNGIILDEYKAEELITSGVSEIIVSIDGVSQEVYEKYRVGGNVQQAWQSLYWLQQFNIKHGNKINISPQFIVFKHNQHEMLEFNKICSSIGLQPAFKSPYIRTKESNLEHSELPQFIRPRFPDIMSLRKAMIACPNALNVFTILFDGSVVICCHDYSGLTTFGNIFDQDVIEIWDDPSYRKFRWQIISSNAPDFCINNCMTYFLDETKDCQTINPARSVKNTTSIKDYYDDILKINLCCGPRKLEGFINIDISSNADIIIDLENDLLPFPDESIDTVVCISAINYFTRQRAQEIIKDVYRVLKKGGVVRFGVQDLRILAEKYLSRDESFYFQKLPDGRDRFPGATYADKLNEFFYGFYSGDKHCQYVYDYESLSLLFKTAGFSLIERKDFCSSRIPDIEKIDNRPEQMFFLETVKGDTSVAFNTQNKPKYENGTVTASPRSDGNNHWKQIAFDLWNSGNKEKSWQYFLKALSIQPDDRQVIEACATILKDLNRREDLAKLYQDYLSVKPLEHNIEAALLETMGEISKNRPDPRAIQQRQLSLKSAPMHSRSDHTDADHLLACIKWIMRAQDINPGGGVSALYYMDRNLWEVDYPETTGYIIPTLLCCHKLTGDETCLKRAIAMGDWECDIQSPEGGAGEPVGVYGQRPRVFNTAQVILGWLALFQEIHDKKYLEAAIHAADWIIAVQDGDGKWTKNTYRGPKSYKSRVSWALLEVYAVVKKDKYRLAAEQSIAWILDQALENGWFENNSLSDPEKPWTHLIGYVLVGLLESYLLDNSNIDRKKILTIMQNTASGITEFYLKRKTDSLKDHTVFLPATFDRNWSSQDHWSCVTGTAQVEFFLRRLTKTVQNDLLLRTADLLVEDLKMIHFMDPSVTEDIYGGLPGAYPIDGGYCTYAIPNWGVKFFADSLLQRLLGDKNRKYLG
jgi:MoaA/NifB/PqqE/SkfB family radical SAM enzyme/predicted SAM-dependent methyltransferase